MDTARDVIRVAMESEHGSIPRAAAVSGLHHSRLYDFLNGGFMEPETAGRLRAVLRTVPPEVWLEAQMPLPYAPAEASVDAP